MHKKNRTLIIVHRGAIAYAPENSFAALKKAVALGFDGVEFDVHLTKDGEVIVMHDHTVKRTTDGRGYIRNLTLKQIRAFHESNGEPVPTLEEVLRFLKKNRHIANIEIKDKGMEREVLTIVKRTGSEKLVYVSSLIPGVIKRIKRLAPNIQTEVGFCKVRNRRSILRSARLERADSIGLYSNHISLNLVAEAHRRGLKVHAWLINGTTALSKMKRLGVDLLEVDVLRKKRKLAK